MYIDDVPVILEKFKNNTIDKEKLLFLLVFQRMGTLNSPGRLGTPEPNETDLSKKTKIPKKPADAYKEFVFYCTEIASKYPLNTSFSKWVEEMPTAGFINSLGTMPEWRANSVHKKSWQAGLQEYLYTGLNLYLKYDNHRKK